MEENMYWESTEAIKAGEAALKALKVAKKKLETATEITIWDKLHLKFMSALFVKDKLKHAVAYVKQAKLDMCMFRKELQDVSKLEELGADTKSLDEFADGAFEGFSSDFLSRERAASAKKQVSEVTDSLENILQILKNKQQG